MLNYNKMKQNTGMKKGKIFIGTCFLFGSILLSSCLNKETQKLQDEENSKIANLKSKYTITEADAIGQGVYLQFIGTRGGDTLKPQINNVVIVTYTGEYSDGTIFDLTDSVTAVAKNLYSTSYIYGPARIRVGYSIAGINLALMHMNEGSEAKILIPSAMAWNNYEPLYYHLSLLRVITNDTLYENNQRKLYTEKLGLTDSTLLPLRKTFAKIIKESTDTGKADINYGDSIYLSLQAYYAEVEPFLTGHYGRKFFPIGPFTGKLHYAFGDQDGFPLTTAIDSAVFQMKTGEVMEVVTGSENAYGPDGFLHPANFYIVPPYMPVHYIITLDKVVSNQ
jgi:FKBP-type peptidyl-prolyl cis-trans isomerase